MYIIFYRIKYHTVKCLFSSGKSREFGHLSSLTNDEIVCFDIRGQPLKKLQRKKKIQNAKNRKSITKKTASQKKTLLKKEEKWMGTLILYRLCNFCVMLIWKNIFQIIIKLFNYIIVSFITFCQQEIFFQGVWTIAEKFRQEDFTHFRKMNKTVN